MSKIHNGLTREIWLWLLREGGFSTTKEIATGLGQPRSEEVGRYAASMHMGGFVTRREKAGAGTFTRYGISLDCKVPMHVSLQDIADCGALNLAQREEATA